MPLYQHKAQAYSPLGFLKDHAALTLEIFNLYGSYLGPYSIPAKLNESIMITVNSVNECPFCTVLHTEGAANLAGVDGKKLQCANTAQEARDFSFDDPAITFAHVFGETGGHGDEKDKAFAVLVAAKGKGQANSIHALCRYMMWGGRTGNTIQGFLCGSLIGKPRPSKSPLMIPVQILFELVLTLWYSFLFLIAIPVVGKIMTKLPTGKAPDWVAGVVGCVLVTVAGSHIVPWGIVGLVLYPLQLAFNKAPPPKAPKGCKAVDVGSTTDGIETSGTVVDPGQGA